jgi:hypothetical protein
LLQKFITERIFQVKKKTISLQQEGREYGNRKKQNKKLKGVGSLQYDSESMEI